LWWVDLGWMPGVHQAALSLPFLAGLGRENIMQGLWVEIRAERDHSAFRGKTDLT